MQLQTHCLSVCRSVVPLGAECDPRPWGAEFMPDYHVTDFVVSCTRWIIFLDLNVSPMNSKTTPPGIRRFEAAGHTENEPPPSSLTPPLLRVTEGNGTRHTCVSVPFPLSSLFYSTLLYPGGLRRKSRSLTIAPN